MSRAILFLLALLATPAFAAWPEKPIKVLIGYAPGGSTDVVARLISPKLGEKLGQPIIIENKPGGAGDFAAEVMLQSPNFLFRFADTTNAAWRPYATASRLAYALWDSTPDDVLLSAAARGELGAVAVLGPAQWVAVAYLALVGTPLALYL